MTLWTDETAKKGQKVNIYGVTDANGRDWVLGLRDITSKSALDALVRLKEILDDIAELRERLDEPGTNSRRYELLLAIEHTMSDRAATETRFNSLLEAYMNEVLPLVRETGPMLEGDDMAPVIRLNNFFCGLHDLVHLTETGVAVQREWESAHYGPGGSPLFHTSCFRSGESAGSRTIQAACKAFAAGGDEKNGCHDKFKTYVRPILQKEYGTSTLPITKFLGARFNILGRNAVYIYGLWKVMIDFLELNAGNNMLLKSLLHEFKLATTEAQVLVSGLCSKLILTPDWNVHEDKSISMSDMGPIYAKMISFFDSAAENPSIILEGQSPFEEKYIDRDIWLDQLLAYNERTDPLTTILMGQTMASYGIFARRQFRDFLPGGVHANLTKDQVLGVPKTNRKAESGFGFWDHLKKRCPSIKPPAAEARILWSMNKTSEWYESLDAEQQKQVMENAMKSTPAMLAKSKERERQMLELRAARLQEQREQVRQKEVKEVQKRMGWVAKVEALGGLWKSEEEMEAGLKMVVENAGGRGCKGKLLEALKDQMNFRKNILQQTGIDAKDWSFSEEKKALDVDQLKAKLAKIINQVLE